ncbi:D-alanine--D-alanine ligase [bacterium AH-315-M05]|nr:D-alanine--D-alanine ligase [bacterium AH-315-M05]
MKKNIAIVTGGNSSEYDISLQSAETIINNIDKSVYDPFKIVINGDQWVLKRNNEEDIVIDKNDFSCIIENNKLSFDCAFIAIHGTPGEDGKLQGYFDMLNIPYTTPGVLTTSLTFNKNVCNNFLKQYGVVIASSILIKSGDHIDSKKILAKTNLPCFVKPNNGGSSCGISKVSSADNLEDAINKAFKEDDEILVEEFIDGIELTCGIVKNKNELLVLPLTEIISKTEFFDYEAKYTAGMAEEITPARVSKEIEKECKELSAFLYNLLNCRGMVRFDYILSNGKLYFLELNTVPGLTENSLVPKQAAAMGIPLKELFGMVIEDVINE